MLLDSKAHFSGVTGPQKGIESGFGFSRHRSTWPKVVCYVSLCMRIPATLLPGCVLQRAMKQTFGWHVQTRKSRTCSIHRFKRHQASRSFEDLSFLKLTSHLENQALNDWRPKGPPSLQPTHLSRYEGHHAIGRVVRHLVGGKQIWWISKVTALERCWPFVWFMFLNTQAVSICYEMMHFTISTCLCSLKCIW